MFIFARSNSLLQIWEHFTWSAVRKEFRNPFTPGALHADASLCCSSAHFRRGPTLAGGAYYLSGGLGLVLVIVLILLLLGRI
jgi:hypothetical protein